ncbi:MAG: Crp/Fnr family transcriptional regulator [Hyphomicrobiaceae bacterium]
MDSILDFFEDLKPLEVAVGHTVLMEGTVTNRLCVLLDGVLQVHRNEVTVALISEPGAILGEMSILLGEPHTASVRSIAPSRVYLVDNAREFLASRPQLLFPIARLLARRLQNSTSYLVDLKKQFQDQTDHMSMVADVLASLSYQQDSISPPNDDDKVKN